MHQLLLSLGFTTLDRVYYKNSCLGIDVTVQGQSLKQVRCRGEVIPCDTPTALYELVEKENDAYDF